MRIHRFVAVVVGLLFASTALAGLKDTYDLSIYKATDGSGSVFTSIGSVRNSSSTSAYVYCTSWAALNSTVASNRAGSCYAYDGTTYASCTTQDEKLTDAISKIRGDDLLYLQFDANGVCTSVQVYQGSLLAPKDP